MFKTLNKNDILRGLESILPKDIIKVDEPLKRYTYTETGGEADFYLSPTKNEEVQAIVKFAHENSIPVTYLEMGLTLSFEKVEFEESSSAYYLSIILKPLMMQL